MASLFRVKRKMELSPTQMIALVFVGIILLGTGLLCLPFASRNNQSCDFLSALFTATSATCVTGLVMFDTWTQWTGFGQSVILCLIEIGGLGFVSAASLVAFLLRRKVGLRQRMLMAQALSVSDMEEVVKLQKAVLVGSVGIQLCGAAILTLRFWPDFGFRKAAIWGVFHAVSAFCNAGFDIWGSIAPGASMAVFYSDWIVSLTLMALIVLGGLGFFVWRDMVTNRRWKKFSVYTKLVLLVSGVLILVGTVLTLIFEWDNPATLGAMSVPDKFLNALFQSVTLRTAGFASFDQGAMTEAGKASSVVLMIIGGSSGSTAGGVKTVTIVVLVLFLWARLRGKATVNVLGRTVPDNQVMDAMTLVSVVVGLALFGGIFICATSPTGFTDALYESVSAIATVGLTTGITTQLSVPAKILIIIYMYFGRVGLLTLSMGFLMGKKAEERFRYAHTNFLIG